MYFKHRMVCQSLMLLRNLAKRKALKPLNSIVNFHPFETQPNDSCIMQVLYKNLFHENNTRIILRHGISINSFPAFVTRLKDFMKLHELWTSHFPIHHIFQTSLTYRRIQSTRSLNFAGQGKFL